MLELVGSESLRNAVSLNSVIVNVARVIGPAVAGVLIATVGEGECFLLNAASFIAVIASLVTLDRGAIAPSTPSGREPGQLREGLRYIKGTPELAVPLVMMALVGCLAYEFQVTLPYMASQGLHAGATAFGFMTSAMGLGAVIGGLVRGHQGQDRPAPADRRSERLRCRAAAGGPRAQPAAGARRARAGGRCEHLVHGHRQLHPSAERRAEHARPRDVIVVRGLPGLDADRRSDRGLDDGPCSAPAPGLGLGGSHACSSPCSGCSPCVGSHPTRCGLAARGDAPGSAGGERGRRSLGAEPSGAGRALALREEVFCHEQGVPREEEIDGRDGEALRAVAPEPGGAQRVIGTTLHCCVTGRSPKSDAWR